MGIRRLLAVLSILSLVGTAYAGQEVQITACGQFVPNRATGVLVTDLDCDAAPGPRRCFIDPAIECSDHTDCPSHGCHRDFGVMLLAGSTLELNGYTISGGDINVSCLRSRCTVRGPGELSDTRLAGVSIDRRGVVEDLTIRRSGEAGVYTTLRGRVTLTNVSLLGNEYGVSAGKVRATNVTANDNVRYGVAAGRIKGVGITTHNNGAAGVSGRNDLQGVLPLSARIDGLAASNNGEAGINAKRVKLLNSFVIWNYTSATSGERIDVLTEKRPQLLNTECGRSARCEFEYPECLNSGETWGICIED